MVHRLALVTGASSGIGAAFARSVPVETGLLLTARDRQALERARDELARPGRVVEVVAADLTTDEGRAAVIERAETLEVDLLINNAGTGAFGAVVENTAEDERATVELDVVAIAVLTRALLPAMIERAARDGRRAGVILVSSVTAFQPVPYLATYAAAKAFILSYGEALAVELSGKPIDVLVLCPGATRTAFGERTGLRVGALPGAADADRVARAGLGALGRRTVHVLGMGSRAMLAPVLWSRHAVGGGLGRILSVLDGGRRREGRLPVQPHGGGRV